MKLSVYQVSGYGSRETAHASVCISKISYLHLPSLVRLLLSQWFYHQNINLLIILNFSRASPLGEDIHLLQVGANLDQVDACTFTAVTLQEMVVPYSNVLEQGVILMALAVANAPYCPQTWSIS
jgi:hypothetical protein